MIDGHEVISNIRITKRRAPAEIRMEAKALLLETFPQVQGAGQLILHYNPGRNLLFVEWQERSESLGQPELSLVPAAKTA